MISTGATIETDFMVNAVRSGEKEEVSFSELLDKPSIVSIYMKNNTSSCDKQNKSLAEHANEFHKHGYNVIAVSKDGAKSHQNYAEKMDINYTLVSDPDNKFAQAVDAIVEKKMYGKTYTGPARAAFVIDSDGTVLGVIEKIDTKNHADELFELIESINTPA